MKPVRQGPKHWLALLTAGILLFAGGGGTGYMLGQQQAKSAQTTQMKNAPKGMKNRPSGAPSGMPNQSSSSGN
ncbi:hypothetical protein [Levilactobacillus yiduensis]|uniref:hypothetical protein n=1 Tax=Levilactobacillus yiduensis TaxID=2953880 RepID=UPI000EF31F47|nr:hypothetical protein [Levilactobacillus yiduensis]AYM01965.1 hypothetical protein D8911_02755 [Levilactobacillus brevis]